MDYLYRIYGTETRPVDSGDAMRELPKVGDLISVTHTPNHPQHRVVRVVDRTDEPSSGGQARCDVWVVSNCRPNLGRA